MRQNRCSKGAAAWWRLLMVGVAVSLALLGGALGRALADAGDLDTSFGDDGIVITGFFDPEESPYLDRGYAMTLQDDGKIVVVGTGEHEDLQVVRYNDDGTLDTDFGGDGKVTTFLGGSRDTYDERAWAVAIQRVRSNRSVVAKIVVAGQLCESGGYPCQFLLARYLPNGTLDATFGFLGVITTDFGGSAKAYGLAIQRDGRIVAAGYRTLSGDTDFALARFNSDGSLDAKFGKDGKLTTDFKGQDEAAAVAIQRDGKIILAGRSEHRFALARYLTDGRLDERFGEHGKVVTEFSDGAIGRDMAIQRDGKIVVAGYTLGDTRDFALARYQTNGSLDAKFGVDGKLQIDFLDSQEGAEAVAVQRDGKIVVAGGVHNPNNSDVLFGLTRMTATGRLDTTFGDDGKVTTPVGDRASVGGMAIQRDGKIVVAGYTLLDDVSTGGDLAVARYKATCPRRC